MIRKAFKTCAAGLAAGLSLLGGALPAMGQTPPAPPTVSPGDWPNLGAFNNRQSRNVSPFGYNSGVTQLRYEAPETIAERNDLILDNTDLAANAFSAGGPYDDPFTTAYSTATPSLPLSFVTPFPNAAAWPAPPDPNTEADDFYTPDKRIRQSNANPKTFDYTPRAPDYQYSTCVPSMAGGDGTTAAAGNANYFEWKFVPAVGTQRPFALYASVPLGTTRINGSYVYPQRYFVYEIRFGPDRDGNGIPDYRIVDILDTETAGSGFVRLGVQGNEANTYFPASGPDANGKAMPIRVRLYNTVPRDGMVPSLNSNTGTLLLTGAPAPTNTAAEASLSAAHLVYADAARVFPQTGTLVASPTTVTNTGNTANGGVTAGTPAEDAGADWNVTTARTNFAYNFAYTSADVQPTFTQDGVPQGYTVTGTFVPGTDGVVTSYQANPALWLATAPTQALQKWQYSLAQNATTTVTSDDAGADVTLAGFAAGTVNPNFTGTGYHVATAVTTVNGTATATYAPDLADGQYDIYAYVPGNYTNGTVTENYATQVRYDILAGSTVVYSSFFDESKAQGWVHLGGNARFPNTQTALPNEPLRVVIYNQSADANGTLKVYVDALKFVGSSSAGFTSSPVHATVGITPQGGGQAVDTKVVLVADESGHIHCLDEAGRGDGTTTEYWTYPTTIPATATTTNPYMDPNLSDLGTDSTGLFHGEDGLYNPATPNVNTPTAKMPTGFDLSTAAVARVYPNPANLTVYFDLLYVGSTNGKVYCIDMSGRGDYNAANRTVGTTRRHWTFPNDYDPSNPTAPVPNGNVGAFRGSVVYGDPTTAGTTPSVFIATTSGRVYSLDALGTTTTTTTTTRWQFPAPVTTGGITVLPSIQMTPTLFLPTGGTVSDLFFGTTFDTTTDGPGQFYCLNAQTGTPIWSYNDSTGTSPSDNPDGRVTSTGLGSFVAGLVAVDKTTLGINRTSLTQSAGALPTLFDTVYVLNANGYLYGLNVANGNLVDDGLGSTSGHAYITNALTDYTAQNLSFTFGSDNLRGAQIGDAVQTVPMIALPGSDGFIQMFDARPEDYNGFSGNLSNYLTVPFDYRSFSRGFSSNTSSSSDGLPVDAGDSLTSVAASNNFMFVNDIEGVLHALDNVGGAGGNLDPGVYSGYTEGLSPNDPRGAIYRQIKIRLVTRAGYTALRTVNNSNQSTTVTYAQVDSGNLDKNGPANPASPPFGTASNPYAFEWGETAYVCVYNFPYAVTKPDPSGQTSGTAVPPPDVTVTFSVNGQTTVTRNAGSHQFANPTTSPTLSDGSTVADGYAVASYVFNNSGASAQPPGNGTISAAVSTSAISGTTSAVRVPQPRGTGANGSTVYFTTANPLAIVTFNPATGQPYSLSQDSVYNVGYTNVSTYNDNLVNGTPNVAPSQNYPTDNKPLLSQLNAEAPLANHGTSTTVRVGVVDRSLIALIHEDGLSNFRLTRSSLQRQGGANAVVQPLNSALYPGFEDVPTTDSSNNSLDYPDIAREQVRSTLSAAGTANPIGLASTLLPPTASDGTQLTLDNYSVGNGRQLKITPLDLTIDVPRYQPPVYTQQQTNGTGPGMPGTFGHTDALDPLSTRLLYIRHDSNGDLIQYQGYLGRVNAFIDSNTDNKLTLTGTAEAYRSFNLTTGVNEQYSLLAASPTVDLGSLAAGTGYAPSNPAKAYGTGGTLSPFSPWIVTNTSNQDLRDANGLPNWSGVYRSVVVENDGNVNMRDLRLAKAYTANDGTFTNALPWALTTADNDPLAWMGASLRGVFGTNTSLSKQTTDNGNFASGDLWSNVDSTFAAVNRHDAANGENYVILPKPRVTDRVPTALVANPYPRANPNLALSNSNATLVPPGTAGSHLVDGKPFTLIGGTSYPNSLNTALTPSAPNVAVSVPLGFPVGSYSTQIRFVENLSPPVGGSVLDNDILQMVGNVSEVYSNSIMLTYKVRETRMTNAPTTNTAAVIDSLVANPNYSANSTLSPTIPTTYRNAAPTALRDANGQLVVAWESDRAAVNASTTSNARTLRVTTANPSRIYLANAANLAGQNDANGTTYGNPPLWDLSQFAAPTNSNQWFTLGTSGYPSSYAGLFPGGTPIDATVSFGSPSFPQRGVVNPLYTPGVSNGLPPQTFGTVDMGLIGSAQVKTDTGRITESKVFLATVTPTGGNGATINGSTPPLDMGGDPQTQKGKPSVLQLGDANGSGTPGAALVFFSETGAGQSSITVSRLHTDGTTVTSVPLGFGDGFSSVFSPSASARTYVGQGNTIASQSDIVDLSFAGKLRGRANAEVYLGRLRLDATNGLVDSHNVSIETNGAGSPFAPLPIQSNERMITEGNGVYRARGVNWVGGPSSLIQMNNGVSTSLLIDSTRGVDPTSGIIAYDSRLGGKVYIDPALGTIRFAGAFPSRSAEIRVTYMPYFLRVIPGGTAAYSAVNGLWDDRYALDYTTNASGQQVLSAPAYWFAGSGTFTNVSVGATPANKMRDDRYFFAYARGASGSGVAARLYTTSMRLGVRLPTRIATDMQGNVLSIHVTGNKMPYQLDPANGRVYFMAEDEDNPNIKIIYTGVTEATNAPVPNIQVPAPGGAAITPSFVLERTETQLAIDGAANDSAVSAFVDPFTSASFARPPLYWLFYTSTRAGGPDLYFQSVAPNLTPFAKASVSP